MPTRLRSLTADSRTRLAPLRRTAEYRRRGSAPSPSERAIDSHRPLQPGDKLDRFELRKFLGRGTSGQVWLAVDSGGYGFSKRVALKVRRDASSTPAEPLLRDARIRGALNHPNIVDVYGVVATGEHSIVIMEYVEGETLDSLRLTLDFLEISFPRSVTLDIGIAVSEALHHAWTGEDPSGRPLRIVHRDLKPQNILISHRGVVKVGDFGIARVATDPRFDQSKWVRGTPAYMAPELWRGVKDSGPASDVWSLGVVLWEMVTGRRFLPVRTIQEIPPLLKSRTMEEEVEQAGVRFPEAREVLPRMLARDPAARFQSPLSVAESLRAVRGRIGRPADLQQFVRLVRAGRIDPAARHGSLTRMPAIPADAEDWIPLLKAAEFLG